MAQTLGSRKVYDALEHELGVFMRRARAAADRLSRAVHPELDSGAYGLLSYLRDHGPARPSDLAGFVGVGKATISRQVKVLEDLGLIERRPDPADRRAHRLALTAEGTRRLERGPVRPPRALPQAAEHLARGGRPHAGHAARPAQRPQP